MFELGDRDANFARHRVNRFAAQQAQNDSAFAPGDGPALEFGGAGGVYGRATRALRRRQRNFLHVSFFNISDSSLDAFYPKSGFRKNGAAALPLAQTVDDYEALLPWKLGKSACNPKT
ncbi:MAG: hypothetical protein VB137_09150 [Burkholderia sp.]